MKLHLNPKIKYLLEEVQPEKKGGHPEQRMMAMDPTVLITTTRPVILDTFSPRGDDSKDHRSGVFGADACLIPVTDMN